MPTKTKTKKTPAVVINSAAKKTPRRATRERKAPIPAAPPSDDPRPVVRYALTPIKRSGVPRENIIDLTQNQPPVTAVPDTSPEAVAMDAVTAPVQKEAKVEIQNTVMDSIKTPPQQPALQNLSDPVTYSSTHVILVFLSAIFLTMIVITAINALYYFKIIK
ncbi:MAG: hypothetical protein WCP97_01620 [bacterium]